MITFTFELILFITEKFVEMKWKFISKKYEGETCPNAGRRVMVHNQAQMSQLL